MQISALNSQKWPHAMPKTFATIILQQQKDAVKPTICTNRCRIDVKTLKCLSLGMAQGSTKKSRNKKMTMP